MDAAQPPGSPASLAAGSSSDSFIPGVTDVSFPPPGEDTQSTAAGGLSLEVGRDVFWATREGG
jgi:hypothetical protein